MRKFDYIGYAIATTLSTLIFSVIVARVLTLQDRGEWGIILIYASTCATLFFPPILDYFAHAIYKDGYFRNQIFEILIQLIIYGFLPITVTAMILLRAVDYANYLEIPLVAFSIVMHNWIVGVFLQRSKFQSLYLVQLIAILFQLVTLLVLIYTNAMSVQNLAIVYSVVLIFQSLYLLKKLKVSGKELDFSNPFYVYGFLKDNTRTVFVAYLALVGVIVFDGLPKIYLAQKLSLVEFGKLIVIIQFTFSSFGIVNGIFKSRIYALAANNVDEKSTSKEIIFYITAIYIIGSIFAVTLGQKLFIGIYGSKFEVNFVSWINICAFSLSASVLRLRADFLRGRGFPHIETSSYALSIIIVCLVIMLSEVQGQIDSEVIIVLLIFMNLLAILVTFLYEIKYRK